MIIRTWKARATVELESDYLEQVRSVVLPHLKTFNGYRGARFARREVKDGIEILVLTFWDSQAALMAFAGEETSHAYMPPEIAATLVSYDLTSDHYEVIESDGPAQ